MLQEAMQILEVIKSEEVQELINSGSSSIADILAVVIENFAASGLPEASATYAANYVAALEAKGFSREEAVGMCCHMMSKMSSAMQNIKTSK